MHPGRETPRKKEKERKDGKRATTTEDSKLPMKETSAYREEF